MKIVLQAYLRKVSWIFAVVMLLLMECNSNAQATVRSVAAPTFALSSMQGRHVTKRSTFSAFVGNWEAHGAGLVFHKNGSVDFSARVYSWCSDPGVRPPCDYFVGNDIIDGQQEHARFFYVSGYVAYGKITASTFRSVGLAVTLTLLPGNQVFYTGPKGAGNVLCGPHAAIGACGA